MAPRGQKGQPAASLKAASEALSNGLPSQLFSGDNLPILKELSSELSGQVDFVYVDPPFFTNADWGAFSDRWASAAAYLAMLGPRLETLAGLLSPMGSMVVHLDWHMGHHVRALLGEMFGEENSLGEVIWAYGSPSGGRAAAAKLVKSHDVLYWFAKARGEHIFNPMTLPYSEKYIRDWFRFEDEDGRRYRKRWRNGTVERQYLDASKGMPLSTVWTDLRAVYADPQAYRPGVRSEITGYPTQKPLRLLERLIAIGSNPGSLVVDAFCGSGTTLVAAHRLGRRSLGIDQSPEAIAIAHRRLVEAGAEVTVTGGGGSLEAIGQVGDLAAGLAEGVVTD